MTMTEQNGIDILCDAAGSDLLLSSLDYLQSSNSSGTGNATGTAPGAASAGGGTANSNTNNNTTSSTSTASANPHLGLPPIAINPAAVPSSNTSPFPDTTLHGHQQQTPGPPRAKRPKTESALPLASTPTSNNHVCQICKRVYERADHLTRHLRSHENARQYQCTRCPKRFNRADLLTRHETTHDRDNDGKGRTVIRRSDRAAEACLNCATSKAKCDDMKPCTRCRVKNLVCETSNKKTPQYRTADGTDAGSVFTPSEHGTPYVASASMTPVDGTMSSSYGGFNGGYGMPPAKQTASYGHPQQHPHQHQQHHHPYPPAHPHHHQGVEELNHLHLIAGPMMNGLHEDLLYPIHSNPTNPWFQDIDFTSWDINFDGFSVPQVDSYSQSPQSTAGTATTSSKPTAHRKASHRDSARRHAAFKRSPWLWEPSDKQDYVRKATEEGLRNLDDDAVAAVAQSRLPSRPSTLMSKIKIDSATRDRLFAIVMSQIKDPHRVPSFPSLELLNFLLQAHLVHDEYQCDSWIHSPSLNPAEMLPELLGAIVANGASFIAVPAIWQFGLSMQEIIRTRLGSLFESQNTNTRKLECLQAYSLHLFIGMWSGFKRKTEVAEAFLQPLLIMMRRAGVYTAAVYTHADLPAVLPQASDSPEVLERKWRMFINRESYKRLALHMFLHDVQTSVALQTTPLLSFTELCFSLPSSRDLWKAPSAKAWRDLYYIKRPPPPDRPMPRLNEIIHCPGLLDDFVDFVDIELVNTAVLHAFWGQISAYRYGMRFYQEPSTVTSMSGNYGHYSQRNFSNHREGLKNMHRQLYSDAQDFATTVVYVHKSQPYTPVSHRRYPVPFPAPGGSNATSPAPNVPSPVSIANSNLPITFEMFMVALHVDLNQLQSFAGKAGEEEARRASAHFLHQDHYPGTAGEGNRGGGGTGGGGWVRSTDARYAVWHAGQVFRAARGMPPTGLRGFNAMAVYFASLTLWVYGLLGGPNPGSPGLPPQFGGGGEHEMGGDPPGVRGGFGAGPHGHQPFNGGGMEDPRRSSVTVPLPSGHGYQMQMSHQQQHSHSQTLPSQQPLPPPHQYQQPHLQPPPDVPFAILDGEETREIRTFLQTGRGIPALTISPQPPHPSNPSSTNSSHPTATTLNTLVESLFANPTLPLQTACSIFRENFPSLSHSESEPLPPLVESLGTLLRDLGRGSTRGGSRAGSSADDDEGHEDDGQDEDEDGEDEARNRDRDRGRDRDRDRDEGRSGAASQDRERREDGGGEAGGHRRGTKAGAAGVNEEDRRMGRVTDGLAGGGGEKRLNDGREGARRS